MKHSIACTLLLAASIFANAQPIVTKKTPSKTAGQTTVVEKSLQSNRAPIARMPGDLALPDLKFTAVNVAAVPSGTTPGTYTLNISYTIKNDGAGPAVEDDVTISGFLTNEDLLPKTKDLSFTGNFSHAGGAKLSAVTGSGSMLAPGASKQLTYRLDNVQLSTKPKPVYFVIINPFGGAKESNIDNNRAEVTILL